MTNNSSNQKFTNNSDGFTLGGGTTERDLTLTSGSITLDGGGSNTYTFPASTDTLVGRASGDTLTNKTITDTSNLISYQTFTNPYKFSVYQTTSQSIGGTTSAKIKLDTSSFDTSGNFDIVTNHRFTAPIAGFYQFNGGVQIGTAGVSTNVPIISLLYKNGSEIKRGNTTQGSGNTNTLPLSTVSALLQLDANDYIELWGYNGDSTRSTGTGANLTYMSGFLVSPT